MTDDVHSPPPIDARTTEQPACPTRGRGWRAPRGAAVSRGPHTCPVSRQGLKVPRPGEPPGHRTNDASGGAGREAPPPELSEPGREETHHAPERDRRAPTREVGDLP